MKAAVLAILCAISVMGWGGHPTSAVLQEPNPSAPFVIWLQSDDDPQCYRCATTVAPCTPAASGADCRDQRFECLEPIQRDSCPAPVQGGMSTLGQATTMSLPRPTSKRSVTFVFPDREATSPTITSPRPKPNRCRRCVQWSGLECVKHNEKGECVQWKYRCLQWETYPC